MCFVWILEQTAIISLYSINLPVFKTEAECLQRGTSWVFKSDRYSFVLKGLTKSTKGKVHPRAVPMKVQRRSVEI